MKLLGCGSKLLYFFHLLISITTVPATVLTGHFIQLVRVFLKRMVPMLLRIFTGCAMRQAMLTGVEWPVTMPQRWYYLKRPLLTFFKMPV
jgi:hypothetical protein